MTYKYGDRIMVGENDTFGQEGEGTVISTEREIDGSEALNYLPDGISWYPMPCEGTPWEIGQWCVLAKFVTPLDNEE